jgi:hypothetical protein
MDLAKIKVKNLNVKSKLFVNCQDLPLGMPIEHVKVILGTDSQHFYQNTPSWYQELNQGILTEGKA